jgi:LPXTG-motif cell wall-anchored protein
MSGLLALIAAQPPAAGPPTWAVVLALLGGNLVGIGLIVWVRRRRRRDG